MSHNNRTTVPLLSAEEANADIPVNKLRINENLNQYIQSHTRESPVLQALRQETAMKFPQAAKMAVSPDQGSFLAWLVGTLGVRNMIEVGVFTGYSSLSMALALPDNGRLVACDRDPKTMEIAEEYWKKAGVHHKIEKRVGPAMDTLQVMLDNNEEDTYDFAFVDADKKGYRKYYEILLKLIKPGGVIGIDNVLWYGKVADTLVDDATTQSLRELNDFLLHDPRISMSLVSIGDGIILCRKNT